MKFHEILKYGFLSVSDGSLFKLRHDQAPGMGRGLFAVFSLEIRDAERLQESDADRRRLYEGTMVFVDVRRSPDHDRDHGASGALRDLEASLLEFAKLGLVLVFVAGPLREDEDGTALFDIFDGLHDDLQALLDVFPV